MQVCNIRTTDNTLEVYDIPGHMLEVYNILNTRDNFAGSFDRLTSDPVLATDGWMRISGSFQQYSVVKYNPFALGNTITGSDCRTNIFGLNSMEKHISQFQLYLLRSHFNTYGTCQNWQNCLAIFVLVLVDWVQSQQNSGAEQSEPVACNLKFWIQFQGELG